MLTLDGIVPGPNTTKEIQIWQQFQVSMFPIGMPGSTGRRSGQRVNALSSQKQQKEVRTPTRPLTITGAAQNERGADRAEPASPRDGAANGGSAGDDTAADGGGERSGARRPGPGAAR